MRRPPETIAIAGAWGYIGRKILDAALTLGLRPYVYDPGKAPEDLDLEAFTRIADEEEFYRLSVDLFHLALHPEHRKKGEDILLERALNERIVILNEKPMAPPERPRECLRIIRAVDRSGAIMLYDFPELFDPMTRLIAGYLSGFEDVEISSVFLKRSKDRESPENPRNYKRMVPIQFQESVHCLAFLLYILATVGGDVDAVFGEGLSVVAESEPYDPPNPRDYAYVVDGKCEFRLSSRNLTVEGLSDFKRGAEWTKRRIVRGTADGEPFSIEADYFEGRKCLRINGVDQNCDALASSYEAILATLAQWCGEIPAAALLRGVYPNPRFAWMTYQLSGLLWKSSHEKRTIELASLDELRAFDSGFAAARRSLPRYRS